MAVPSRHRRLLRLAALPAAFLAAALPALPSPVRAQERGERERAERESGQERARRALERGEIRPLEEILAAVRARVPGEIVKVELEREDGVWRYELKLLTPSGRRREIAVDARTARILKAE